MIKKIDNVRYDEVPGNGKRNKELGELKKSIKQQNNQVSPEGNKETLNGNGTITYENGDTYTGGMKNGKKEGYGTYTWASGHKYEGEYKNGMKEGYGIYTFKSGSIYKGFWKNNMFEGKGTITYSNGDSYSGDWKNDKKEGYGIYTFKNGTTYKGFWKNGKKEGKGTITYNSGDSYTGDWKNDKKEGYGIQNWKNKYKFIGEWMEGMPKEGNGTLVRENGDSYTGYILINNRGLPIPFYKGYNEWREGQIKSGNPEFKNMHGKYTSGNSTHEYSLTNGSITEKSNDFITMYGEKKPDENRSAERGNIEYTINYHSAKNIEYRLSSWKGRQINRKFDGKNYIFKDKGGKTLTIPSSSNFGEKAALHAANLINSIRYFNETKHGNSRYRSDKNNIYSTLTYSQGYASGGGIRYHEVTKEKNGTTLCAGVAKHFGGIKASDLANWLNSAKW